MVEVLSADLGCVVFAHGEPDLGAATFSEIVGGVRAAHPGGDPPGFEGVGEDLGPVPGDREGKQHIVQFAVGVGLCAAPGAMLPVEVFEAAVAAFVQAGAEVHEAAGLRHERGEEIGREGIHREDVGEAVLGNETARLLVADRGVVDHRVERAQGVCLVGDGAGLPNAGEVADEDGFRTGNAAARVVRTLGVAGVQHDTVALLEEQFGSHAAKAVGGAGDEDARHGTPFQSECTDGIEVVWRAECN